MSEPWLGHWDLCSIAWSDWCNCDPDNPIYLGNEEGPDADQQGAVDG